MTATAFGDGWQHDVEVENVIPVEQTVPALCLAGKRAAPPEDCGSVPGYRALVAAMRNPRHRAREGYLQWLGGPYDPETFDLAAVNSELQRRRR